MNNQNVPLNKHGHKDIRHTTEDEDTESIINYYIKVGVFRNPKDWRRGMTITTDWFNKLNPKDKEKVWGDAGDGWWKEYGIVHFDEKYSNDVSKEFEEGNILDWWSDRIYKSLDDLDERVGTILNKKFPKYQKKMNIKTKPTKRNNRKLKDNMITEVRRIVETKLQPTAPFSIESDDIYGGYVRIQYDNQSGTTTEGVESLIQVFKAEIAGWEYILKHEEFYWADGAWKNKYVD